MPSQDKAPNNAPINNTPADSTDTCLLTLGLLTLDCQLCFPLYAAANAMIRAYRPYLEPLGLTYPQYLVLLVLWERDGVKITDIGRRLRLDTGTLTPLIKRLEAAGLVDRSRSHKDERCVLVRLTEAGHALRHAAHDIPHEMVRRLALSGEGAASLKKNLYELIDRIEGLEQGGKAPTDPTDG
jgi:DNA-binding MarR family transcriptional regulator